MAKTATLILAGAKALYSKNSIDSNFNAVNNNFVDFLHLDGVKEPSNTMLGDFDMGGKRIRNIGAASNSFDVATKAYVDQKLTIVSSGTSLTSIIEDTDNDTGVNVETTADLDRVDLFAGTSGGSSNAFEVVGDDSVASSLSNPYNKVLKHMILDTDVRVMDSDGDTYIELSDTSSPNVIGFIAGGNVVAHAEATMFHMHQNLSMHDAGGTAVGRSVGDEDGDTYVQFNKATGGTDDDTFRVVAGGVEVITATDSAITLGGLSTSLAIGDNLGTGSASFPVGATKSLNIPEGSTGTTANDLIDNQVIVYSSPVSGVESTLDIDVKTGASSKSTIKFGDTCTFPNIVDVGGILNANNTTQSTSSGTGSIVTDGGIGVAKNVHVAGNLETHGTLDVEGLGATTLGGTLSVVGNTSLIGDLAINGVMSSSTWPSFSAYASGNQSLPHASTTKLTFNTEDFDTNNNFDSTTNYRFTPSSAGKYLLIFRTSLSGAAGDTAQDINIFIHKNGVIYVSGAFSTNPAPSANTLFAGITYIVDANGTTDYFEIFANQGNSSFAARSTISANRTTSFSGSRIA